MPRIENNHYLTAGIIATSDIIRRKLKHIGSGELRVGTNSRDKGKLTYFETKIDGYRVEITKQRNAPLGILYIRGGIDSDRSHVLERIIREIDAIEVDANFLYDKFERMVS